MTYVERQNASGTSAQQLRAALDRQQVLLEEMQRRHRNTYATIRSIMRRTADSSETVEDFVSHFEGRIDALCRVQFQLAQDPLAGFDLAGLVSEEMLACAAREGEQFKLSGPPVRLQPKMAESMGLAIHELATNSVKYGAFSSPKGSVDICWLTAPRGNTTWLSFDWKESGMRGRPVIESRRGFGMTLLKEALPYDLGAEVKLTFQPGGFRCKIAAPFPVHV